MTFADRSGLFIFQHFKKGKYIFLSEHVMDVNFENEIAWTSV
jgi:hypothetical protein